MFERPGFADEMIKWLSDVQELVTKDHGASFSHPGPQLTMDIGKRYVKIVDNSYSSQRVFGFVDRTNGDILKAATWKAPAKNFPRGNIFDADRLARVKWTGVW